MPHVPGDETSLPTKPRQLLAVLSLNLPVGLMTALHQKAFFEDLEMITEAYRRGENTSAVSFHFYADE